MNWTRVAQVGLVLVATAAVGTPARAENIRLAEGTKIAFVLNDTLSTKNNRVGDEFRGVVSRSVRVGDRIVIPEGSAIRGVINHVKRPWRAKGRAELGLRFDEIELPNGTKINLVA